MIAPQSGRIAHLTCACTFFRKQSSAPSFAQFALPGPHGLLPYHAQAAPEDQQNTRQDDEDAAAAATRPWAESAPRVGHATTAEQSATRPEQAATGSHAHVHPPLSPSPRTEHCGQDPGLVTQSVVSLQSP